MKCLQTIVLNGSFAHSRHRLIKWSPYDQTRLAILVKSGVYVLRIAPVPSNLSPTLNTNPLFCHGDDFVGVEWLADSLLLLLTSKGTAVVKDSNDFELKDDVFEFPRKLKIQAVAFTPGYLITASYAKNKIIVWDDKSFVQLSALNVDDPVGEILPMKFGSFLVLFATLANGQAVTIKMDEETRQMTVISSSLWSEEDHIPARYLSVVSDDNLVESRACKLLFAKGNYIVISKLDLSHPTLETINVSPRQWIQAGTHNVVDIKQFSREDWLIALEHGPLSLLKIPSNLEDPCDMTDLPSDVDLSNYSCQGLERSKNGYIWACLQEGPINRVDQFKCKVTLMTPYDCHSLKIDGLSMLTIDHVDLLEAFRMLVLLQPPEQFIEDIYRKMVESRVSNFKYWISVLFSVVGSANRELWSKMASETAKTLLVDHAKKQAASNPKHKPTLMQFIADQSSAKSGKNVKYEWICKTCKGKPSDKRPYLDVLLCENGHRWPRCCISLQVCDSTTLAQCSWCKAVALPEFADSPCSLCCSRLLTV